MPFSTASARLKLNILFDFVVKLGLDSCFKCGKCIKTDAELSVEHKIAWLDRSPDLFWDLENIAFSHRKCNKAERFPRDRKIGPEGTIWCSGHKEFLDEDKFRKDKSRWSGYGSTCKKCRGLKENGLRLL